MTIEEKLSEAASKGLLLNNLFQLENDIWQANFRSEEELFSFGRGKTPVEALADALDNMNGRPKYKPRLNKTSDPNPEAVNDLFSLIGL